MLAKHIVICGERNVGKTTLVQKLLDQCTVPIYGFMTQATPRRNDGYRSIYLHPAGHPDKPLTEEYHIGECNRGDSHINLSMFNTLGCACLKAQHGGIVVMDELGFLENEAAPFCEAVLNCLDGDIPVLATVKFRSQTEFLDRIRSHPNVRLYTITTENRDLLYQEMLPVIQSWNSLKISQYLRAKVPTA